MLISGISKPQVYLDSREAIRDWVEQNHRGRLDGVNSRHHQTGTVFDELTSTSARTRTMVLVTHQNATDLAPRPTLSGVYTDHWRKTPNGWRLTRRSLQHDQHTPYHSSCRNPDSWYNNLIPHTGKHGQAMEQRDETVWIRVKMTSWPFEILLV